MYIEPGRFYVDGVGIIDSNGKLVEEDDVPYTNDDEVDLEDDFADDEEDENDENDEEEGDDGEDDLVDDEKDENDEEDKEDGEDDLADDKKDEDDPALYLLRKLVRGVRAILKELEL